MESLLPHHCVPACWWALVPCKHSGSHSEEWASPPHFTEGSEALAAQLPIEAGLPQDARTQGSGLCTVVTAYLSFEARCASSQDIYE